MKRFFSKVAQHLDKMDAESIRGQYKGLAHEFAFLESVLGVLDEGILVSSPHGELVYANPAAEKFLNFAFADVRDELLEKALPGLGWEDLLAPAAAANWARTATREIELTYPERRILALQTMPAAGFAVVLVKDVTEARDRAADAVETERLSAIEELASGVAHEIGNPLNALALNLDLMARDLKKDAALRDTRRFLDDIEMARHEVRRIDQINRSFLTAVRPVKPRLRPGSVAEPLKSTLAELNPRFTDRAIRVTLDLPPALPTVLLDAAQLQQVFFNLIKNALEAMPDGGALALAIEETDAAVEIAIRDTGKGIPAADLAHLFEPYRTTKGDRGHGLGLLVSRRIVRAHGGEIDVESKEGEGTRFTVRLPRLEKRVRRLT